MGECVEACRKGAVAGLAGKHALGLEAFQQRLVAGSMVARVERNETVCRGVVVILGQVVLQLRAGKHVAKGELVIDPDALPVVERPELVEVVVGEVLAGILLGEPVGIGAFGKEAKAVGPGSVFRVEQIAGQLVGELIQILLGHASRKAIGEHVLHGVLDHAVPSVPLQMTNETYHTMVKMTAFRVRSRIGAWRQSPNIGRSEVALRGIGTTWTPFLLRL